MHEGYLLLSYPPYGVYLLMTIVLHHQACDLFWASMAAG